MNNNKLLNLCAKHSADDGRVYAKISKTLVTRGYDVHNTSPNAISCRTKDNIQIHGFLQKLGLFNRIVSLKRLYDICVEISPDFILAHEPDALVIGYIYYKLNKNKSKLFFDCHEAYESWYNGRTRIKWISSLLNKIIISTINFVVKRINGVTSVNRTMTERFKKINQNSYMIPSIAANENTIESINNKSLANSSVFFGQFGNSKQKEMLIRATEILKKKGIKHLIAIIGGEKGSLKKQIPFEYIVKEKGLSEYFKFYGWLDSKEAFEKIRHYPVGIMRFDSYTMIKNYAMPNKIFEYMSNGLAVLSCNLNVEISNIIREERCGILISEETGEELADALIYINEHSDEILEMRKNAYNATKVKYNWNVYGDVLENIFNI